MPIHNDDMPIELTISSDKIAFIVIKARAFDVKVEPDIPDPGSNPSDDQYVEVLEDYPEDMSTAELHEAIVDLNDDEKVELVAMVWLGRGDFDRDSWGQARKLVRDQPGMPIADYLMGIPMFGDYLEEGFAMLGHSTADTDAEHL